MIKGCLKYTCTEPAPRKYRWAKELAKTKCCSFNKTIHPPGPAILSRVLSDDCTTVSIRCKKKKGFANLDIEVKDNCPEMPGIMNVQLEPNATISSAGFPGPFPPNQDECWTRTPTCGHSVHLKFAEFNVSWQTHIQY